MAHTFTLTDGTVTVTLSSGAFMALRYERGTQDERNEDGITETLSFLVAGANLAAIATSVRPIETLLEQAKRRARLHTGARVFFRVQWDTESEAWQAEVTDGRLEDVDLADQLRRGKIEMELVIVRRFFETVNWTQLTLTNTNGTNNTAGLNVYLVNDGVGTSPNDRVNYLAIDAAEITGSLPGAVKIELANGNGAVAYWSNWFLSVNAFNDPTNFAHMIEAESTVSGGGAQVNNAAYSGGAAWQYTQTGTHEQHYTLSAAAVQDCAGMPFRVLLGFASDDPPAGYVTAQIRDASGTVTLSSGDRVQMTGSTTQRPVDCGVLTIPPGDYSIVYGALRLVLVFYTATSQTVTTDWIALLPAETTRFVKGIVGALESAEKLVVDESEERCYVTNGTNEFPYLTMQGQPLLLQPGVANRIYVIAARSTGTTVTDKLIARAWVKQRRLTL